MRNLPNDNLGIDHRLCKSATTQLTKRNHSLAKAPTTQTLERRPQLLAKTQYNHLSKPAPSPSSADILLLLAP